MSKAEDKVADKKEEKPPEHREAISGDETAEPQPVEDKVPCTHCKEPLKAGANFCNACRHYQDWRRFFFFSGTILTQLTTLFTVVGGLFAAGVYVYTHLAHSHTSITFAGANDNEIFVHVSNTGWRPSTLRGYRLRFDELPIVDAPLDLVAADMREIGAVPARTTIKFALTTTGLRARSGEVAKRKTLESLSGHSAKLEIDIQESSDPPGGPWQVRSERFSAERIRDLLEEKLPDDPIY